MALHTLEESTSLTKTVLRTLPLFAISVGASAQPCPGFEFLGGVLPLNGTAHELVSADVSGDGRADLISFASNDRDALLVWVSTPGGVFLDSSVVQLPGAAFGIRSGDMDGDGREEILVVAKDQPRVYVARIDAAGGPGQVTTLALPERPASVTPEDLDADGDLDLAMPSLSGQMYMAENDGTGMLQLRDESFDFGAPVFQVRFADLDGDGDRDGVASSEASSNTRRLSVISRTGSFGFIDSSGPLSVAMVSAPALVDVDADGDIDAVATSDFYTTIVVHRNNGAGELSAAEFYTAALGNWRSRDLQVFDANGDSLPEVAFIDLRGNLFTMLNQGGGVYADTVIVGPNRGTTAIAVVGSVGDSSARLAEMTQPGGVSFLSSDTAGQLRPERIGPARPAGGSPRRALDADINADGLVDLITLNRSPRAMAMHIADGSGGYAEPVLLKEGQFGDGAALGDLNGDGLVDIAAADISGAAVRVLFNAGDGAFTPGVLHPLGSALAEIRIADLNGDGWLDLIGVSTSLELISYTLNRGDGTFGFPINIPGGNGLSDVFATDVDGDGDADLVASHTWDREIAVYANNGDGLFDPPMLHPSGAPLDRLAFADVDSDGDLDAVARHAIDHTLLVAENLGQGVFGAGTPIAGPSGVAALRVGDLDRDGDPDIAALLGDSAELALIRNDGDGTWSQRGVYRLSGGTSDLILLDADGDGETDIASCSFTGDSFGVGLNLTDCGPVCVADLAEPFGELNFFDIAAYIGLYGAGDAGADLAEPFGVLNFFDISAYITAYNAGCPE